MGWLCLSNQVATPHGNDVKRFNCSFLKASSSHFLQVWRVWKVAFVATQRPKNGSVSRASHLIYGHKKLEEVSLKVDKYLYRVHRFVVGVEYDMCNPNQIMTKQVVASVDVNQKKRWDPYRL